MKTISIFFILVISLFIYSCGAEEANNEMKTDVLAAGYDSNSQPTLEYKSNQNFQKKSEADEMLKTNQKIIKNGTMRVESEDAIKSKASLSKSVNKLGGYFEKEEVANNHRMMSYDLVVRVPAKNFEKLVSSIEQGGDLVSNKSITADDVTEDFYDVQTRLSNKRAYLKRYQELLNKANTIQDILDVEEKIRVLEEEIESAEGRLRYLSDQVGFSTLRLNLFEKKAYYNSPEDTFSDRVKRALQNGWSGIVHLAIAILTMWPFILLGGIAVYIFRRYRKRSKNKS